MGSFYSHSKSEKINYSALLSGRTAGSRLTTGAFHLTKIRNQIIHLNNPRIAQELVYLLKEKQELYNLTHEPNRKPYLPRV